MLLLCFTMSFPRLLHDHSCRVAHLSASAASPCAGSASEATGLSGAWPTASKASSPPCLPGSASSLGPQLLPCALELPEPAEAGAEWYTATAERSAANERSASERNSKVSPMDSSASSASSAAASACASCSPPNQLFCTGQMWQQQ